MTILWRPNAKAEFEAAARYLLDRNETAAHDFRDAVVKAAGLLSRQPQIARFSRYEGFRAWSLPKWSKVIVFREIAGGIEIAALLDVRREPPTGLT